MRLKKGAVRRTGASSKKVKVLCECRRPPRCALLATGQNPYWNQRTTVADFDNPYTDLSQLETIAKDALLG